MNRDTVTIEEITRRLSLGRNSVYAALQRGEIPRIKIGRRYLVPRVRFERWLAGTAHEEQFVEQPQS